jgi:hypothetical protein
MASCSRAGRGVEPNVRDSIQKIPQIEICGMLRSGNDFFETM